MYVYSRLAKRSLKLKIGQVNRILVVEDEDLIRELLILALEQEGYAVTTATAGQTAFMGDIKTLDVHLGTLRQKLECDPKHPERIVTVRGFGYRL